VDIRKIAHKKNKRVSGTQTDQECRIMIEEEGLYFFYYNDLRRFEFDEKVTLSGRKMDSIRTKFASEK